MSHKDIQRKPADWSVRICAAVSVIATLVWIKVLVQALSMIGGK